MCKLYFILHALFVSAFSNDDSEGFYFVFKISRLYNTHAKPDGKKHVGLNVERIKYWLAVGAQPSTIVATLLSKAGLMPQKTGLRASMPTKPAEAK